MTEEGVTSLAGTRVCCHSCQHFDTSTFGREFGVCENTQSDHAYHMLHMWHRVCSVVEWQPGAPEEDMVID